MKKRGRPRSIARKPDGIEHTDKMGQAQTKNVRKGGNKTTNQNIITCPFKINKVPEYDRSAKFLVRTIHDELYPDRDIITTTKVVTIDFVKRYVLAAHENSLKHNGRPIPGVPREGPRLIDEIQRCVDAGYIYVFEDEVMINKNPTDNNKLMAWVEYDDKWFKAKPLVNSPVVPVVSKKKSVNNDDEPQLITSKNQFGNDDSDEELESDEEDDSEKVRGRAKSEKNNERALRRFPSRSSSISEISKTSLNSKSSKISKLSNKLRRMSRLKDASPEEDITTPVPKGRPGRKKAVSEESEEADSDDASEDGSGEDESEGEEVEEEQEEEQEAGEEESPKKRFKAPQVYLEPKDPSKLIPLNVEKSNYDKFACYILREIGDRKGSHTKHIQQFVKDHYWMEGTDNYRDFCYALKLALYKTIRQGLTQKMVNPGEPGTLEGRLVRMKLTKYGQKQMKDFIEELQTKPAPSAAQTSNLNNEDSKEGGGSVVQAVQPILICTACYGDATHNTKGYCEKLLSCAQCGISVHPSCAGVVGKLKKRIWRLLKRERNDNWLCEDCRLCEDCGKGFTTTDEVMECAKCDFTWHKSCINRIRRTSGQKGAYSEWVCQKCKVWYKEVKRRRNLKIEEIPEEASSKSPKKGRKSLNKTPKKGQQLKITAWAKKTNKNQPKSEQLSDDSFYSDGSTSDGEDVLTL
jgi:hypothetical protein